MTDPPRSRATGPTGILANVFFLGLVVAVPIYFVLRFALPFGAAVERAGSTWEQFLEGEAAAWLAAARPEFPGALAPTEILLRVDARMLFPLGVAVLVFLYWRYGTSAPASKWEAARLQALALAPVFAGMLWSLEYLRECIQVLAEAGLTNPGLVGIALAESVAGTVVGCLLTLVLLVAYRVLTRMDAFGIPGSGEPPIDRPP